MHKQLTRRFQERDVGIADDKFAILLNENTRMLPGFLLTHWGLVTPRGTRDIGKHCYK